MMFYSNTYYTIPNSSMYVLVLSVLRQDEYCAKLNVAYITKGGTPVGIESIEVKKENTKHWVKVDSVPFTF